MRRLRNLSLAYLLVTAAFAVLSAAEAETTLICNLNSDREWVQDSPSTIIVDQAAGTVHYISNGLHAPPPGQSPSFPPHDWGVETATFTDNEIAFQVGSETYRLNRVSGYMTVFASDGERMQFEDQSCHVQERQF